jgi:hypothetical protein
LNISTAFWSLSNFRKFQSQITKVMVKDENPISQLTHNGYTPTHLLTDGITPVEKPGRWVHHLGNQWKRISRKQSARWQHLSRLKASALFFLQKNCQLYEMQQLLLGIGYAI